MGCKEGCVVAGVANGENIAVVQISLQDLRSILTNAEFGSCSMIEAFLGWSNVLLVAI
jgi:hypothetical protein